MKNFGEADKFYIKDHHKPIISREAFDKVQELIESRKGARAYGRLVSAGKKGVFSSRIRCGYCGYTYGRKNIIRNVNVKDRSWSCIQNVCNGRHACLDSKTIKEDVIKKAFVDSFKLLVRETKVDGKNLLDNIKNAMRDNSPIEKIKELNVKKNNLKSRKNKLVDCMIDGTISKEIYQQKLNDLESKIDKVEKEIESYTIIKEDDDKIENGIYKISQLIQSNSNKILNDFDEDVFTALVDYIVIGGYDETGKKDQFMIRFICKTNFKNTIFRTKEIEHIVETNHIPSDKYLSLLDFESDQHFFYFNTEGEKRTKKLVKYVRVRVEVEV